ncbi:unnamed protein product [Phytomonas sp. EM1]|nr:unnamed protein product [Phytomonas sp. EM1]|eukprot:CCW65003.1 unnamed protein product [Phytomonas sp. isolate EM1]
MLASYGDYSVAEDGFLIYKVFYDFCVARLSFGCAQFLADYTSFKQPSFSYCKVFFAGDSWVPLLNCCARFVRDQLLGEFCRALNCSELCVRNIKLMANMSEMRVDVIVIHEEGVLPCPQDLLSSYPYDLLRDLYASREALLLLNLDEFFLDEMDLLPLWAYDEVLPFEVPASRALIDHEADCNPKVTSNSSPSQSNGIPATMVLDISCSSSGMHS